jgi:hypothetical protein
MVAKTQILEELSARAVLLPTLIEEGLGRLLVPRLAGQQHDYLVKTLMDFRNHTRANNPPDVGPHELRDS